MRNLAELVARFQREAIAGAHVQHPNVASATDFGRLDDGSHYLVLEYVRGVTLHDLLNRGHIPVGRALNIARQIAAGLDAAHRLGVLHRDVKPSNVMLVDGDQVKVIDFGLAKVPDAWLGEAPEAARGKLTQRGKMFGTIAYMPPEAAMGMDTVDQRADLYALGIVLYKMLTGKHPFDASDPVEYLVQHQTAFPPPLAVRTPGVDVPRNVEALVMRLLKKDVRARFPTAQALMDALDEIISAHGPTTPFEPRASLPITVAGADAAAAEPVSEIPIPRPAPLPAEVRPAMSAPEQLGAPARRPSRTFEWLALVFGLLLIVALALAALRTPSP
jgi:serine/threonine protein kinase